MNLSEQWQELIRSGKARWMAGMLTNQGARILRVTHPSTDMQALMINANGAVFYVSDVDSDEFPDFEDPATESCLLSQLRERYRQYWTETEGSKFVAANTVNITSVGSHKFWACRNNGPSLAEPSKTYVGAIFNALNRVP